MIKLLFLLIFIAVGVLKSNCQITKYIVDQRSRITQIETMNQKSVFHFDDLNNRTSQRVISSQCIGNMSIFRVLLPGTKFQWQVKIDSAASFTSISDNNFYYGTRIDSLIIINPSTAMVGYKYRCAVTLDGETS